MHWGQHNALPRSGNRIDIVQKEDLLAHLELFSFPSQSYEERTTPLDTIMAKALAARFVRSAYGQNSTHDRIETSLN
jgi:hypothetical protein